MGLAEGHLLFFLYKCFCSKVGYKDTKGTCLELALCVCLCGPRQKRSVLRSAAGDKLGSSLVALSKLEPLMQIALQGEVYTQLLFYTVFLPSESDLK